MKYKKIATIILAASMILTLAGCGGNTDGSNAVSASVSEANEPVQAVEEKSEAAVNDASAETAVISDETKNADEPEEAAAESTEAESAETDSSEDTETAAAESTETAASESAQSDPDAPEIPDLTFDHTMQLDYADCFSVYYYQDGYKLIVIPTVGEYLVIPEGSEAPEGLDPEIHLLYQPLDQVYMAATGSMSFIEQIDAMDCITMSSLDIDGWVIDAPKKAMEEGTLIFAGKYSEPDYEMMIGNGCDLAVESTMILHSPEVQEMIEDLGIPVLIDRSSYELDAFGRIEWIKLYAAIFNKEELAAQKFAEQEAVLDELKNFENTGKTIAFFAVNSNKTITVRRTEDFIPNMIELAGGKYIFDDLDPAGSSASVRLSMEEFYNTAVNADYLIYNGTIEEPLNSAEDLIAKSDLFSEFKAVQEGNVWTVDKTWYQSTATIGYLITDINRMVTDGDPDEMVFLHKVQ